MTKEVVAYIDGFALYKGLLQRTYPKYKWLDIKAMVQRLYSGYIVTDVYFFTADLKPMRNDPGIGQRQQKYLQALEASPGVHVVRGSYIFSKNRYPYHPEVLDEDGKVATVQVRRPEEKGSDVNLATQLLMDAFMGNADVHAVLTNDSDLVTPMREASVTLRRDVSLISVVKERYNGAFHTVPLHSVRQVREGTLKASQLPDQVAPGIRKPKTWP